MFSQYSFTKKETGKEITISTAGSKIFGKNVQSAAIMIAVIPLLILYPFMQKYFIKGIMVGSVKEKEEV